MKEENPVILTQLQEPTAGLYLSTSPHRFPMTNKQQDKDEQDNKAFTGLCEDAVFNNRNRHMLRHPG